jgi:phenylacetate-CoA ligase
MVTQKSLDLFHKASREIRAYAEFLKSNNINPEDIKSAEDYKNIPITSKKTYLQKYPLHDLVWGGDLNKPLIFCATSGSTGAPYYFPRTDELSQQYSKLIENYLMQRGSENGPTLIIVGFGMGIWIGGIITVRAIEIALENLSYPGSILPVGYNKTEIIKAMKQLAPQFSRTILIGYPPFIKEVLDEAAESGIDLKSLNLRLLFAAESFTENFRDYLCNHIGADPILDTLSIYGTADIGAMAYETPVSILIRRLAIKDQALFKAIFGQISKTPTLAQYNPDFIEFEEVDGEILLNGNSALPLIRYAIGDHGGVISPGSMRKILAQHGYNLENEVQKAGIKIAELNHPFVFVYERTNFAVSLQGIIIYPEFIKEALIQSNLSDKLTGKFTMLTQYDENQDQYLEINIELRANDQDVRATEKEASKAVIDKLVEKSSEFSEVAKTRDAHKLVKLVFWPQGDPKYFQPGVKQKWVA